MSVAVKSTRRRTGRPPRDDSPEIKAQILALIADKNSLNKIAKMEGMPSLPTIYVWLQEDEAFFKNYARACEDRADAIYEETIEIADDATNDWMVRNGKDGEASWVLNGEHVQRSRLRIDTRKWFLAKMNPRKYGEKIEVAQSGTIHHAHHFNESVLSQMTREEIEVFSGFAAKLLSAPVVDVTPKDEAE